jgi:hypothetical protein
VVPVQTLAGVRQSAFDAQVVLHAVAPQAYGLHELVVAALQVPAPSQVRAALSVDPVQLCAAHTVPFAYSWQAPLPSHDPLVPQLAAPLSVHWLSGSLPAGTVVQVPTEPVSAHDWQVPAQAALQHTPWAQKFELQSVLAVHAVPLAFRPQVPAMQVAGAVQSASTVQVVLQTLLVVSQANGTHSDAVAGLHVPAPSQARAGVNVEPTQVAAAHGVPVAYRRQPPLPSQVPSVPQLAPPLSVHWDSGSLPAGTLVQVPALPDSAHDWQVPVQLELQQTPCWQKPEAHSLPMAQVVPCGFLVHRPLLQTLGDTQSASAVQVTLQTLLVVSHWNAPQEVGLAAAQVPAPSHSRGGANVDPTQLPAAQGVPDA